MLRRAARRVTVPQALVLAAAVVVTAAAVTWVVFPGTVAVDPLAPITVEVLQEKVDALVLVRGDPPGLAVGPSTGFAIEPYVGASYRCAPGELGSDDSEALGRAIAHDHRSFAFLDGRLQQQRERCLALGQEHARVAALVIAATLVVALALCVVLRGGASRLVPPKIERRSTVGPGSSATRASPGRCRICGELRTSPLFAVPVGSAEICDRCIRPIQQVPLFFLWWLSALLLAVAVTLGLTGYSALAALVSAAGSLVPILALHVVLHETGHAVAGFAMGVPEVRMRLGSGPLLGVRATGRLQAELRLAPSSAFTMATVRTARHFRLRTWVIDAAGPLVTAALVAGAWWAIPSDPPWTGVRWIAFGLGVFLLVTNLIPITRRTATGQRSTDGAQLLVVPFLDTEKIDQRLSIDLMIRLQQQSRDDATMTAAEADREAIERGALGGNPMLAIRWALLEAAGQDWERLVTSTRLALELAPASLPSTVRAMLQNNLAWALLRLGRADVGGEADELSAAAVAADPSRAASRGTRAEVLAALGRFDEARAMAHALIDEAWSPDGEPRWDGDPPEYGRERHLTLAAVELAAGDLVAARGAIATAERVGADPVRLGRLRLVLDERVGAGATGVVIDDAPPSG